MEIRMLQGMLKWPKGLWRQLARVVGSMNTCIPYDSTVIMRPGYRIFLYESFVESLPEPFAQILDFDALERTAEEVQKAVTEKRQELPKLKALREYLKPDVTRTEELLLTAELSSLETCSVVRPECDRKDCCEAASRELLLRVSERGLIVEFA